MEELQKEQHRPQQASQEFTFKPDFMNYYHCQNNDVLKPHG